MYLFFSSEKFHHVPNLDAASERHCTTSLNAQGRNCERNYDDCLPNPCPAAYSCVDGINAVSCLPPATDAVPPATRVPAPNGTPAAERYTGASRPADRSLAGISMSSSPCPFSRLPRR